MSAYKDALHITVEQVGSRLALAQELLATGEGVVVLNSVLALRPSGPEFLAEVIATQSGRDFAEQVEAAKSLLAQSTLAASVNNHKLSWLVVDDYGMGTAELWHPS